MTKYNQESRRRARAKYSKTSTTKQYTIQVQKKDMELFDAVCKQKGYPRHTLFSKLVGYLV